MSIVRDNLMNIEGYTPYCGNSDCMQLKRTRYKDGQFHATCCHWVSDFPEDFIEQYKLRWEIEC